MNDEHIVVLLRKDSGLVSTRIKRADMIVSNDFDKFCEKMQFKHEDGDLDWSCSICFCDAAHENGPLVQLPCNHVFHARCMWTWVTERVEGGSLPGALCVIMRFSHPSFTATKKGLRARAVAPVCNDVKTF